MATIDMGEKWGAAAPLTVKRNVAWTEPYLHTKWYRDDMIHPAVWLQYTNVTDRQDVQITVP